MDVRKVATWTVVGLAVVYSGFLVHRSLGVQHAAAGGQSRLQHAQSGFLPGEVAPSFTLKTTTGKTITLASLRGRGVWLNFWATWCPHCKQELPIVEQEQRLYGQKIDIVGVDVQESQAQVQQFAHSLGLTYPIALDSQGGVAASYGIHGLPTQVFVAPNGVIKAVYEGAFQNAGQALHYLKQIDPAIG